MLNRFKSVFLNNFDEPGNQESTPTAKEKPQKYKYSRPAFLSLTTEDLVQVTNDHKVRPIIVPREPKLPWCSGYAECINAGKSLRNEDQAYTGKNSLRLSESDCIQFPDFYSIDGTLPYTYFGLFDGHAGYGASVAASNELHQFIHNVLSKVTPRLLMDQGYFWQRRPSGIATIISEREVTHDQLIIGALEEAFHLMDARIAEDKCKYDMRGGCTALVALFILGKIYVANAGDTRAVLYKSRLATQVSNDFTPETESHRLRQLAAINTNLLGNGYTIMEYNRKPYREEIGKPILFRDHYMIGWSSKAITKEDLRSPLISGEGKRSRLLATIGVTRGFGDHELRAVGSGVPIKPFLCSQPEVKVIDISADHLRTDDVLIMATDGLWDVISNEKAGDIVQKSLNYFGSSSLRYICAAQDLVMQAKGKIHHETWKLADGRAGTVDDVSVFVIPLLPYQKEYSSWKESQASDMQDSDLSVCFGQLSLKQSPGKTSLFPAASTSKKPIDKDNPAGNSTDLKILNKMKETISLIDNAQASSSRDDKRTSADSKKRNRSSSVPSQDGKRLKVKRSKSFTDLDHL